MKNPYNKQYKLYRKCKIYSFIASIIIDSIVLAAFNAIPYYIVFYDTVVSLTTRLVFASMLLCLTLPISVMISYGIYESNLAKLQDYYRIDRQIISFFKFIK